MKIQSFIKQNESLVPVEVEVSLMPGLPQIQFLGLADQAIKESTDRIKSAIRQQGFEFPSHQKVVVNLRPSGIKKNSQGLDLAVAALILWESGQLPKPLAQENFFLYGELNLQGFAFEPLDFDFIPLLPESAMIVTGHKKDSDQHLHNKMVIRELSELSHPQFVEANFSFQQSRPTSALRMSFSQSQALLYKLVALGEHHILLAGSSGSGKSTWAENLVCFLRELQEEEFKKIYLRSKQKGFELNFRPLVRPHHTIPPMAMIGGGSFGFSGEINRAHRGLLVMDEFLEFHPKVLEALREPMEQGEMRIARGGKFYVYENDAVVVATTNLCPCGDYIPGKKKNCSYTIKRCQSYLQKFSGPVMDRFHLIAFTNQWTHEALVEGEDIANEIEKIRDWKKAFYKETNAKVSMEVIYERLDPFTRKELLPSVGGSKRRLYSTLRVAATLADIDFSEKIKNMHINKAMHWTYENFQKLKRWD